MRKKLLTKLGNKNASQKRKYPTSLAKIYGRGSATFSRVSPAITKFSSNAFRKGDEIKTLDLRFTGSYTAGTYTPDTEPLQQLPINGTTGVVQALNLVQQGAGLGQRIGNKISLKSLRLRMMFNATVTHGQPATYEVPTVRVMVIYDRQPNGNAYPALNSILSQSTQSNTIVSGIFTDSVNPNWFDRFVVLHDEFIVCPQNSSGDVNTSGNVKIDAYIKLRNLESQFNGTNSPMTYAYINIGALYICVWGDQGQVINSADAWQLYGSSRLRFRDN